MSNLGDSNTPIEGQSFGLPAGAELGEDNGDVVIKDSTGTIILRRDETNAEWQFENTDLTGINLIDASSANLGELTDGASNSISNFVGNNLSVGSGTLNAASGGYFSVIDERSVSNVISLEFPTIFDGAYSTYTFRFTKTEPTANAELQYQLTDDSGSSYITSGYRNALHGASQSGTETDTGGTFNEGNISIGDISVNVDFYKYSFFEVTAVSPSDSDTVTFLNITGSHNETRSVKGTSAYLSSGVIDGIKFFFSGGTDIKRMDVTVLGAI